MLNPRRAQTNLALLGNPFQNVQLVEVDLDFISEDSTSAGSFDMFL